MAERLPALNRGELTLGVAGTSVFLRAVLNLEVDGRLTGSRLASSSSVTGQQKDAGQRVLDRKHDVREILMKVM